MTGKNLGEESVTKDNVVRLRDNLTTFFNAFPLEALVVCRLLSQPHENEPRNSPRAAGAFLSGHASARDRKSIHNSASMCRVKA